MKSSLNSKKNFKIQKVREYLSTKDFVGLYNLNSLNVSKRLELKNTFKQYGFHIQVINNSLFEKTISLYFKEYENIIPLSQGFLLMVVPIQDEKVDLVELKKLFIALRKEGKTLFFLGGVFNKTLINDTFAAELMKVKTRLEIFSEIVGMLERPSSSIISNITIPQSELLYLTSKKD